MRTNDSRKLKIDALNERRRQVAACLQKGMTQQAAAELCGMSRGAVRGVKRKLDAGGLKAVEVVKDGRPQGKGRILTREQERDAQKVIADRTPDQLKLPYALWTRQAVREMIQGRYNRKLALRSVGNYLKRWGYTPQQPLQKAYEQRPEAVRKWLEEEFPEIKERAKAEGASIHWCDETGLRSDDTRGRSYAPKGKTPAIRINQRRHSCSVISVVTNKGAMRWMVFRKALNAKLLIKFLKRLIKDAPSKIFLVLDNLKVHHSKPVKAWLEKNEEAIECFFLPSYSPELNPVELANASLKHAVTTHAPARRKGQMEKVASNHLRHLQRNPKIVQNFFQKDSVKYAA
ncbi:MAG: IS630 family transposase [Flavobacteriales bacterium]|nr:IS630 family transposase [Flavobacteriales bacterium]